MSTFYNDTNPALRYHGSWTPGTWKSSSGESGTLHSTNAKEGSINLTFPVGTIQFSYYGMKRSNGGLYKICIDCTPGDGHVGDTIDAYDLNDDGDNPPSLLYNKTLSAAGTHWITITNTFDARGRPAGNSQLTITSIEYILGSTPNATPNSTNIVAGPPLPLPPQTVPHPPSQATVASSVVSTNHFFFSSVASPTATIPFDPVSSSIPPITFDSTTATSSGSQPTSNPAIESPSGLLSSPLSHGAIIGIALAALVVLSATVVLLYWLHLRRKYKRSAPSDYFLSKAGNSFGHTPPPHSSAPSTTQRERDLGPLPEHLSGENIPREEKGDFLPPAYAQVFSRQLRRGTQTGPRSEGYAEIQ